jgi:hypothetical protein
MHGSSVFETERLEGCGDPASKGNLGLWVLSRSLFLSLDLSPLSSLHSEPLFLKLRWKCTLFWETWKESRLLGDRWARDSLCLGWIPEFLFFFYRRGQKGGRSSGEKGIRSPFSLFFSLLDGGGNLGPTKRCFFCCSFFPLFGRLWYFFFRESTSRSSLCSVDFSGVQLLVAHKAIKRRGTS